MKRRISSIFLAFLISLSCQRSDAAQVALGEIHGKVVNPIFPEYLPAGIQVSVISSASRLGRSTLTDENGNYSIGRLLPGPYTLRLELLDGFSEIKEFTISAGNSYAFNIQYRDNNTLSEAVPTGLGTDPTPEEIAATQSKERRQDAQRHVELLWCVELHPIPIGDGSVSRNSLDDLQGAIVAGFRKLGNDVVPPLILALNDSDAIMRRNAAIMLGRLADTTNQDLRGISALPSAVASLIAHFEDSDASVRSFSVSAVGMIGLSEDLDITPMIRLLQDQNDAVRQSTVIALGRVGTKAKIAFPMLQRLLEDPNPEIHQAVLRTIDLLQ